MERLVDQQSLPDTRSRRHHYVPKSYLREWSPDGKRIWMLDTVTHTVRQVGLADACVQENFHRVVGPDGQPHNRVELLFGVVDAELRRIQRLFTTLSNPDTLQFDDLLGLGVSVATQRMRTPQQRRLQRQYNRWLVAQNPSRHVSIESDGPSPHREAGIHTETLFSAMWESADTFTTRQIEIWDDPQGRFWTCDAPVLVPYVRAEQPDLHAAPRILWPISPHRVIALTHDLVGEKAAMKVADGRMVGLVRDAVEEGRERMIFASEEQRTHLPSTKLFRRRAQSVMTCSDRTPRGELVPPPGCCVRWAVGLNARPQIHLCRQGLHRLADAVYELA